MIASESILQTDLAKNGFENVFQAYNANLAAIQAEHDPEPMRRSAA
mgnify:CR=1 FL=1